MTQRIAPWLIAALFGLASGVLAQEGAGLLPLDPSGTRLIKQGWSSRGAVVRTLRTKLPTCTLSQVASDTNREGTRIRSLAGVPNLHVGFRWNLGDSMVLSWYPQGISGSADARSDGQHDGRKLLLVSWYHKKTKGVRISVADVTDMNRVRYRHVLLVDPKRDVFGRATFGPVPIHAGGIVWYGRYLYVVDTTRGLRVFDTQSVFRVRTGRKERIGRQFGGNYHAHDYKYAMPQIGSYSLASDSASARFSFVSLDRSTWPHTLLTGEYAKSSINGKLHRWSLDPFSGLLDQDPHGARPLQAFVTQHDRVQGAQSWRGKIWLSCSSQKWVGVTNYGRLYTTQVGARSRSSAWCYGPEDLHYAPASRNLWTAAEHPGARAVFCVKLGTVGG